MGGFGGFGRTVTPLLGPGRSVLIFTEVLVDARGATHREVRGNGSSRAKGEGEKTCCSILYNVGLVRAISKTESFYG